ncbi:MAG: hypothetical protein HXY18_18345 [Bryobacteraceae bacterium]|nr:hypothetical protein [Bryobacteraceae bacterium]
MKRITGYLCLLAAVSLTATANTDTLAGELKELRSEKRRIADAANELGALARTSHINSWETHAIALEQMKELINRSGARIARLQNLAGGSAQALELREQLAAVAKHVTELKQQINENRLAIRMPAYYWEAMKLVQAAEQSQAAVERVMNAALSRGAAKQAAD